MAAGQPEVRYRPHAYQAVTKQAKSRKNAVISRVGRTICRTSPRIMPEYAGIYRHTNRPNRHRMWPKLELASEG